jgi:hypothetical protein
LDEQISSLSLAGGLLPGKASPSCIYILFPDPFVLLKQKGYKYKFYSSGKTLALYP